MAWFEGFERQTVTLQDLPVTFRRSADWDANKPVLVLLHGFPQTHVMWHRVAQALRSRYRLVMPDLRGYGDSSHAVGDAEHAHYSKRAMAQDARKVLASAIANAENNHNLDVDALVVSEASVGKSITMKRFHTRGRGKSTRILKPFSRLRIVVREVEEA